MGTALRFKNTGVPRQQGELARLKVIQGPDQGAVYILLNNKSTIGRGEENDIIISDLKASRIHAELIGDAAGWRVVDKKSANGILHNGKVTREAKVKLGDAVTIGETTLEFTTSDVGTQMLVAPPRSVSQILGEQKFLKQYQDKMSAMGFGGTAVPGEAPKNNRLIFIVPILGLIYILLSGDDKPKTNKSNKSDPNVNDLANFLPSTDFNKAAETLFKDGFREFRAGNFNRAKTQFETVLQISPTHALAALYLQNCDKSIEGEIGFHLEHGKKSLNAGKLKDARAHFERVKRLLYRDQSNAHYIEAQDLLNQTNKLIDGGGGAS